MVVTWRDAGLWILPESKEEHTALGVLFIGLGGVVGAYPSKGWTISNKFELTIPLPAEKTIRGI